MRLVPPQPLHDYSLIADGDRGVVVDADGAHVWMCSPSWADEPVFDALIGGGGTFQITPSKQHRLNTGSYEPGTLIWRHDWVTTAGRVICEDALAMPAAPDRAVVLRRMRALDGVHWMHVVLSTGTATGRVPLTAHHVADGVWTAQAGDVRLRLQGLSHARVVDHDIVGDVYLGDDAPHDVVLEVGRIDGELPEADRCWERTRAAWKADVPRDDGLARDVRHSHAVIRGLTAHHGGMVAAATTSLPERAQAGRNYDYRYVWIRDLAVVGQALAAEDVSSDRLAGGLDFVTAALLEDGADLRPTYTVDGGPVPLPRGLPLPGYPGAADEVGNLAGAQFQLDVFGECLLLYAAAARLGPLPSDAWKAVQVAAGAIADRADEPDAGIWEIEPRLWTHSRLMCAAGLRGVARLASPSEVREWTSLADRLTDAAPVHRDGHWVRATDDDRVDAALLYPALRGVVPPDDPRAVATVRRVLADLSDEHDIYRFRDGDGPLDATEGAFLLCGFGAAMALDTIAEGVEDRIEAARWHEHTRGTTGPARLFTEEVDPASRQLRGNLPQAFVHGALIESAGRLFRRG